MNIKRLIEIGSYADTAIAESSGARPADAHQSRQRKGPRKGHSIEQEESSVRHKPMAEPAAAAGATAREKGKKKCSRRKSADVRSQSRTFSLVQQHIVTHLDPAGNVLSWKSSVAGLPRVA